MYLTPHKHTEHWMVIQPRKEVAVCCMHAFYYSDSPQDCGSVRHAHTMFYELERSYITSYAKQFNHEKYHTHFAIHLVNISESI